MTKFNSDQVLVNMDEAKQLAVKLRAQGKSIVLTQGSWDLIHVGHARYLTEAKKHGDVLIVGTDSDDKIRLRKGVGRPVVPQAERLEMLTYLAAVDYVALKSSQAPKFSLIKAIKPDVLIVIKENYSSAQLKEIKKYCGQVKVLPRMATTSTSAKLRRVQIGQVKKIESKLLGAIEKVLEEFRN